ncbi:hypothetical protein D9M72_524380 [compost metagenome]
MTALSAFGAGGLCGRLRTEVARIGFNGHVLDQPAHRACAVERALRTAQGLDTGEIEQAKVQRTGTATRIGGTRPERHVVYVHAYRRTHLRTRRDAAHRDLAPASATTRLVVIHAGQ